MGFQSLLPWRHKRESNDPFTSLQQAMNQLFDDFSRNGWERSSLPSLSGEMKGVMPHIDLVEDDSKIEVSAELPGMDEKDINVTLRQGVLTIRGEKKSEREEKKKDHHITERYFGSFQRNVMLPCEVMEDQVRAQFKKGVLTVTLPKLEEGRTRGKQIEVRAS